MLASKKGKKLGSTLSIAFLLRIETRIVTLSLLTFTLLFSCRPLKMETFDSITGNFSNEFGVAEIKPEELKARMHGDAPTLLIDVRTSQEQSVSVLKNAVRVTPDQALDELPELRDFLERHETDANAMVVVYCAGGYRSARSLSRMQTAPELPVRNLRGGIIAYSNAAGELVQPHGNAATDRVHGYNSFWASFILAPREATIEPAIPEQQSN